VSGSLPTGLPDPDAHRDPALSAPEPEASTLADRANGSGIAIPSRRWNTKGEHYSPPVVHPPEVRATPLRVAVEYGPRSGKVTRVRTYLDRADGAGEAEYALPTPARSMLKALVSAGIEYRVTYARGYAIDSKGQMRNKDIWQANTPDENDQRKRIKVGTHPPAPVDSILVRAIWRDEKRSLTRVLGAYWTDGASEMVLDWQFGRNTAIRTATELSDILKNLQVQHG
jgi:hypothetical protein